MPADYRSLPPIGRDQIASDLRALGLGAGDTVLVHSSLSRIGHVEAGTADPPGGDAGAGQLRRTDGAATVVDAFLDVLGSAGTLAVPTFPFTGSMLSYLRSDPDFDVDETPSRMGAIAEEVRLRPGALRSLEPTHPVSALGPNAPFLVEDHVNADGPCDEHSPLYRLTQLPLATSPASNVAPGAAPTAPSHTSGYVLLLGVDFRNCTLLHTAEELARVPFIDFATHYRLRGRTRRADYSLSNYCHSTPHRANFPAIEPVLLARNLLTLGHVGAAECRLARAADILSVALECLKDDPYFLRVR